ncbi:MAG: VWA domain-containing protein, partial [Planctomycetes bacterium]|nr:VWA domain-containing protein [Planctomycetota bacterium]
DYEATITYEQSNARPDRDFQLYYQRKDAMFGLSLLTHRGAGQAGYYMIRIAPRIEIDDKNVLPKDIAFVIDTSGSMSGGKIEQVRRALAFCINSLNPNDRFNIYGFSTDVRPFRESLVAAESDIKNAAVEYAKKLQAVGGTNINAALLAALDADPQDAQRPYLIVFMTDGEPTVDVTDVEQIRRNVQTRNAGHARFHVLGVGTQVNTHLLDKLAEESRGSRDYCTETEDLELKLSSFVTRLANPVLTGVTLKLAGLNTSDQYPRELPDLFRGNDLVVLGRYDGTGHHRVEFTGTLRGSARRLTYEGAFPKLNSDSDFLPRLWANRKVAYLLDQIRLHGSKQELVNEVVRLAKRHGIVTPYTSSLILEDEAQLVRRGAGRPILPATDLIIRQSARRIARTPPSGGALGEGGGFDGGGRAQSGAAAVTDSRTLQNLKSLGYLVESPDDGRFDRDGIASETVIRHAAGKTFVRDGERWLDTKWDGKKQPKKIEVFSDAYFTLLKKRPELSKIFALGARVLVVIGDDVYETVTEDG